MQREKRSTCSVAAFGPVGGWRMIDETDRVGVRVIECEEASAFIGSSPGSCLMIGF
jgi:hypothetical protein